MDALDAVEVAIGLIAELISSSGFFRHSLRNILSLQRRHVLRSRRPDTPLHERSRKLRGVNVRGLGLQRDHRASLLRGHDHQRRMRDGGVDQHAPWRCRGRRPNAR